MLANIESEAKAVAAISTAREAFIERWATALAHNAIAKSVGLHVVRFNSTSKGSGTEQYLKKRFLTPPMPPE